MGIESKFVNGENEKSTVELAVRNWRLGTRERSISDFYDRLSKLGQEYSRKDAERLSRAYQRLSYVILI